MDILVLLVTSNNKMQFSFTNSLAVYSSPVKTCYEKSKKFKENRRYSRQIKKFYIKNFFNEYDQQFPVKNSHIIKKSVMENFVF